MPPIFYVSYVLLWLLLITQGLLLLLVYRHFGLMALGTAEGVQRDGLPVGAAAPAIIGVTADGRDIDWRPGQGRAHLLLFASPGCEPCEQIMPAFRNLAISNPQIAILAVVPGTQVSAKQLLEKFRPPFPCIAEDGSGAFSNYRVRVTPFAFIVGDDGRIHAKSLCSDPSHLDNLCQAAGLPVKVVPSREQLHPLIEIGS